MFSYRLISSKTQVQYMTNLRDIYSKKKTKIKKGTVNPVFEEALEYYVPKHNLK